MESEGLNEKMQWEARRVAAAFGCAAFEVEAVDEVSEGVLCWLFSAQTKELRVGWSCDDSGKLWAIAVGNPTGIEQCVLQRENQQWTCDHTCDDDHYYGAPLARGLYRMGFEEPAALDALNFPLSNHEKLELRLTMPRDFWPQKWRAEEENGKLPPMVI